MSLRPKTKRRLLLLTGTALAVAAAGGAAVGVQLHRHEAARQRLRADGLDAFDRGDYVRATVKLRQYLGDNRTDPPAIYALAVATKRVPKPDGANLTAARGLLARYLELAPTDADARHELLDVYQRLGFHAETLALADALLARDATDGPALTAEWEELYRQHKPEPALAMAQRLADADPADVRAQEATLELMALLRRPPADLVARADALRAAHPDDPRFDLVRAIAAHLTDDPAGTRRWLDAAAARPSPDPAFTVTLANTFDRMGRPADATALLRRSVTPGSPLLLPLVQRLWQSNQTAPALDLLRDLRPAEADVRLVGLKALLLQQAGDAPDALVAALTARASADPAAAGWADLVRAAAPAVDRRRGVALCADAARIDPENVIARFFLGRADLRMGETSLGLECLAQAATLAPAWAAPRLLVAQTLLDRNQPSAAAGPAKAAADRDPGSPAAATALAVIAYRTLPAKATAARLAPVLAAVRAAAAADPADPRLPAAAVDLLARTGGDATAAAAASVRAASPAALSRVAAVAAFHKLDVSAAVVARAAELDPATPADAYDVATALAAVGQADRGRQLLAGRPTADWQLAALRFREATAPTAADAWAALADANPADLDVQRAVLRSPVAAANRPLVDRTVDRLRSLTGADAVEWRLARARVQLNLPPTPDAATTAGPVTPVPTTDAAAVASSMAEVSRIVPHTPDPPILWATALEQLNDLPAAAARLSAAVPLAPDDPALPLRLARLRVRLGQFHEAADAVAPLAAAAANLPPAVAADVADVYRRAGQPALAVRVLAAGGPDPARAVALAQAQAQAGDADAATATLDRANAAPSAMLETVRAAAWFKAARGRLAAARADLAKLDAMPSVSPVQRDVTRGQFDAAFGDPAAARAELEAATRNAPDDPRPWAALAGFDLHAGDAPAAAAAAARGLALAPADAALSALAQRAQTVAPLHLSAAAQPLLDALATDPTNPAAVATLDALANPAALADAVESVAAAYPTFAPAQALVVDHLTAAGRYDDAAAVAQRSVDAAPADPAPARLLATVWAMADRPEKAAAAADVWRARSLAAPQAADAAWAAAQVRLGHPADAAARLAPYVRDHTAADDTVATYARGLSADGRATEADALLQRLAAPSAAWRQTWLGAIADTAPTPADAARRIDRVAALIPPGSVADRVALGTAWYTVGTRFNDAPALRHGLAALDPLTDVADAPTDAFVLMGAVHQQLGDLPAAEAAYRRALAANPDLPRAMNNLAWTIALRDGDLAEARALADRAAALLPADPAVQSTLGQVALKQNDVAAAADAFKSATRLAPRSADAWAGLADAQARAGHTGDAAVALDRAESLLKPPAPPPSPTTAAQVARVRAALGRPDAGSPTVRPVG